MEKLGKRKIRMICIVAGIFLIAGTVVGVLLFGRMRSGREDEKNVFLALAYLKDSDFDIAGGYLNHVSDSAGRKIRFAKDSAEVIRQKLIGNDTLSSIEIDIINDNYKLNSAQTTIVTFLQNGFAETLDGGYDGVIDQIVRQMDIPDRRREKYEEQYMIERMALVHGYLDEDSAKNYEDLCGRAARTELELGSAITNGNYSRAFSVAVDLVKEDPSNENYLILADVISRAVYAGAYVNDAYIYETVGKDYDEEKVQKNAARVDKEISKIEGDIFELEMELMTEKDETALSVINNEMAELREKIRALEIKRDNPFLYRAMNSIRMIPGVRCRVILAKLYYAAGMYDEAETCIRNASGSFGMRFCDNSNVVRGLDLLASLYNGDGSVRGVSQATKVVSGMIDGVIDNRFIKEDPYSLGFANAFANDLLADYKYQDNNIFITHVDDSAYPKITVTLNGREGVMSDILRKRNVVVRDTHYDVDYDVELDEISVASICFVVDVSGSMDGTPIENARLALRSFIGTLDENTEVSIVAFDNSYYERTSLTMDRADLLAGVETLLPGGGTDISEGISGGIESLKNASGSKNLILMTDGQSNEDFSWQNEALADDITIFTVGFGSVNEQYLTQIAELTGGTFTLADSSGDLGSVYSSIGSVIGNRAKITYTVTENIDELPRYVYIRSNGYDVSQSREYRMAGDESLMTADTFVIYDSVSFTTSQMTRYEAWNRDIQVELSTSANSDVDNLVIDGQMIAPDGSGGRRLKFKIPLLKEGLYDITFNFKDGSTCTGEDVIFVYDDEVTSSARVIYDMVRIGSVVIQSDFIIILNDGKVVIKNARIHNADGEAPSWSLNAYTYNFIIFDTVNVSENVVNGYLDWGTDATFHLHGCFVLSDDDAQNARGCETVSSSGKLKGIIDRDQCLVSVIRD